jgi:hypothetical protein
MLFNKGKPPAQEVWLRERDELCKRLGIEPPEQSLLELASLWRDLRAQCERALLDGDADWFERQAKAIKKSGLPQRGPFNAKVIQLLEAAKWITHIKQSDDCEDLTLTPAGKFTDKMASDIYEALEKRELPDGKLLVEGCQFERKERVMDAIRDLAMRLQFALKKQPRKRWTDSESVVTR